MSTIRNQHYNFWFSQNLFSKAQKCSYFHNYGRMWFTNLFVKMLWKFQKSFSTYKTKTFSLMMECKKFKSRYRRYIFHYIYIIINFSFLGKFLNKSKISRIQKRNEWECVRWPDCDVRTVFVLKAAKRKTISTIYCKIYTCIAFSLIDPTSWESMALVGQGFFSLTCSNLPWR